MLGSTWKSVQAENSKVLNTQRTLFQSLPLTTFFWSVAHMKNVKMKEIYENLNSCLSDQNAE